MPSRAPMGRSKLPRNAPAWRKVLAAVERRERDESYAASRELRYDVDLRPLAWSGSIVVHVRWVFGGTAQPAHLHRPFTLFHDAVDAALLSFLHGASAGQSPAPNEAPRFEVPSKLATEALQRLALSRRAHLAKGDGETDLEAPALAWDTGDDYELVLDVQPNEDGTFQVWPALEREGESLEPDEPVAIVGDLLVFRDRVATWDDGGQAEWAHSARAGADLEVAEEDLPSLLEEIHGRVLAPRVELPPERAFERVRVAPKPFVVLHTQSARGIAVEIGLDYDGLHVHPYDPGHALVDRARRRIVDRDGAAEIDAVKRVEALGAVPVAARFRIAKRDLMDAARALLGFGWRVEIDGRVHRRATSLSLGVATGIDWLDVNVRADFDGAVLALPEMLAAIRQQRRSVVLSDGSIGEIPDEWVERLTKWSALAEPTEGALRFTRAQAGLVAALADRDASSGGAVAVDAAFAKAREELRSFDGVEALDPPPSFRGTLREYQRRALGWFAYLDRFGFGGCLADDMGLGKTVQVLALLDGRRGAGRAPSLVVSPRSVLYNWVSEAARFAPELRVLVHDGARRDVARVAEHDVVMTTYGLLHRDAEAFASCRFDYVVLDEAQAIKTGRSVAAKAARALACDHRLALTGTPIENHLGELASILEFLNPGVLGASSALTRLAPGARSLDDETRDLLAQGIRPFFLRRTKQQVAPELPPRVEQTIHCELEPDHRRLYDELLAHYRASVAQRIANEGWGRSAVHVLEALLRLRQIACHPGLVDHARRGETSAKIEALLEHLASARAEGQKALVFSQFTSLLGIVRERLDEAGVAYEYLDGATEDRPDRVARFESDPACGVFLLSLRAGGVGLNLPSAQYVFLLDPWWNPAVEAQAIDRAHRIGQTRTVFAYRLLARGTIEEKVEALQKEKRALADAFFGERGAALAGLTREDLEKLLA
jgi:superfamily II DNA or RNA helicase